MARFYGAVGFVIPEELSSGVTVEKAYERMYSGELTKSRSLRQSSDQVNDNIDISNEISILADPFARENFYAMKYVEFMGARWKIKSIESVPPRLLLTIGGLYNGS